jgi:broad specificity phosphatase PhoE
MFAEVRARVVAATDAFIEQHREGVVAIVSHADPIRAVIGHYLGLELSASRNFRIDHGTLSILEIEQGIGALRLLNAPPEMVRLPNTQMKQ